MDYIEWHSLYLHGMSWKYREADKNGDRTNCAEFCGGPGKMKAKQKYLPNKLLSRRTSEPLRGYTTLLIQLEATFLPP